MAEIDDEDEAWILASEGLHAMKRWMSMLHVQTKQSLREGNKVIVYLPREIKWTFIHS